MLEVCRRYNVVLWVDAAVALVTHVLAGTAVHGFVKDWLAVGPVLLAFVGLEVKRERAVRVAAFLGATSLGVYLVHPLVTRGVSVAITQMALPPFSVWVVLGEWVLAWGISLAAVAVLGWVPGVRRVV